MYKIAIIGRPNTGKSTLFNKLVGRSFAITDDFSGVTRDRKEARAKLGDIEFIAIDTAGLENEIKGDKLTQAMVQQTFLAVDDADLCLFVIDGKSGVVPKDQHFAKWLRRLKKPTILVANKCENFSGENGWDNSFFALGFDEPVGISAEHKLGMGDLYDNIAPFYEKYQKEFSKIIRSQESFLEDEISQNQDLSLQNNSSSEKIEQNIDENSRPDLQIAIIGRPNAGKSTLLNRILGKDRLVTGEMAGITRDSIAVDHEINGQKIRFIDTAGVRKKSNISEKLEKLSASDSFRALRYAQLAILLIDANSLIDKQDLALAGEVLKEGRSLIFAINKIDTIKRNKEEFLKEVRTQIQDMFAEINGAAILGISGQSGYNVDKLMDFALQTYAQWQIKISTSKLNDWIKYAALKHPPKMIKGRETKVKYITQIKTRPPTFAVFTNHLKSLDSGYLRYLSNSLRKEFDLGLTPIRIYARKSENPYAHLAKKKK